MSISVQRNKADTLSSGHIDPQDSGQAVLNPLKLFPLRGWPLYLLGVLKNIDGLLIQAEVKIHEGPVLG